MATDIVITRDNKDFRRLQFLFWKKLDRNQRIRVLAELDMLPYDFEAPLVWLRRGVKESSKSFGIA